jgi:hypothetical protein
MPDIPAKLIVIFAKNCFKIKYYLKSQQNLNENDRNKKSLQNFE